MVHMFPSNIHDIEYVCGLEVLGVQLIYPAMFEHDVQTSRHWAMDGELAAVAYNMICELEHLELLNFNTLYIEWINIEIYVERIYVSQLPERKNRWF